jgi:hypothetical protein
MPQFKFRAPRALMRKVKAKAASEYVTVSSVIIRGLVDYVKDFDWDDPGDPDPEEEELETAEEVAARLERVG